MRCNVVSPDRVPHLDPNPRVRHGSALTVVMLDILPLTALSRRNPIRLPGLPVTGGPGHHEMQGNMADQAVLLIPGVGAPNGRLPVRDDPRTGADLPPHPTNRDIRLTVGPIDPTVGQGRANPQGSLTASPQESLTAAN